MLRANACNLIRNIKFPIFLAVHKYSEDGQLYGRQANKYNKTNNKIIFDRSSILPANSMIKIDGDGLN
jgi:hypothetical protein